MSDTATTTLTKAPETPGSPESPAVLADPADRGTLEVRSAAISHTIERLVLDVDTVVRRRSTKVAGVGLGSTYPKASVEFDGSWAHAEVEVAALWPTRVDEVAAQVRRIVIDQVEPIVGVQLRRADVTVHVVSPETDDLEPRVR